MMKYLYFMSLDLFWEGKVRISLLFFDPHCIYLLLSKSTSTERGSPPDAWERDVCVYLSKNAGFVNRSTTGLSTRRVLELEQEIQYFWFLKESDRVDFGPTGGDLAFGFWDFDVDVRSFGCLTV